MMAQNTLGGAPYEDDFRTVIVELPDGSTQPVGRVPKNISDDTVAQKFKGRVMSTTEDVVRSGLSGVPYGLTQIYEAPAKMNIGFGNMLGLRDPENSRRLAKQISQEEEAILGKTGGDYSPRTTAGRYAKSGTAAAIPIPGAGSAGLQAALGGLSGVLGQGAAEAGLGTVGSSVVSLAPYLTAAGISAARPRASATQMREAIGALSPDDISTMKARLQVAKQNNLNVMPWQMAPEGSELRQLGMAVAGREQAAPMRRILAEQSRNITGTADVTSNLRQRPATNRISGPLYEESAKVPLTADVSRQIQDSILNIKADKKLAPNSPQAKVIDKIAEQFGEVKQISAVDRLEQLSKEASRYTPGSAQHDAIRKEMSLLFSGGSPGSSFKPTLSNYGELQNLYQNVRVPDGAGGVNVDGATKAWVRQAIAKVADADNPLFPKARAKYSEINDVQKSVERTLRNRGGTSSSATTETIPELIYAGATTPLWATVPFVREMGKKALINDYMKALTNPDPLSLSTLAERRPIGTAMRITSGGLLSPVKQGELDLSGLLNEER